MWTMNGKTGNTLEVDIHEDFNEVTLVAKRGDETRVITTPIDAIEFDEDGYLTRTSDGLSPETVFELKRNIDDTVNDFVTCFDSPDIKLVSPEDPNLWSSIWNS